MVITLALPGLAVAFAKSGSGMSVIWLMFFAINPIAAVAIGVFAGKNIPFTWFQPLLLTLLFLMGSWIFLDMREKDFFYYAIIYLLFGYASMLTTSFVYKKK